MWLGSTSYSGLVGLILLQLSFLTLSQLKPGHLDKPLMVPFTGDLEPRMEVARSAGNHDLTETKRNTVFFQWGY